MSEIIINNQEKVDELTDKIKAHGLNKLHVLADFDRTITKGIVDGKIVPSLISVLRDEGYLTPDYPKKAHALFDRYHPIEIDPAIPIEQKKAAMEEWWETHFELLMASGLKRADVESVVRSKNIQLRNGAREFIEKLQKFKIPLVIMSASGLGREVIEDFFRSIGLPLEGIYIISNQFEWDKQGRAVKVLGPVVHGFNKDETLVSESPFYDKIKDRKNVILIGDSDGDATMAEGFAYDNLLKIGFLDENIAERKSDFLKNFDVVIMQEGGFEFLNKLLDEIK